MKTIKKRLLAVLLAVATLLGILPMSTLAADVTMDLSKAEVSWDYTLKDEDGNAFSAVYGLNASDNPFGYSISAIQRSMHDYTAKRPGLGSDKSQWVYGRDYVYCFCIEHGVPLPNANEYAASSDPSFGDKYKRLSATQRDLLALALTYGYTGRTDVNSNKDANACYAATQLIIWQITLGFRTSATELNDRTYPGSGYTGTMTEQYCRNKYLKRYYDLILSDMANHFKYPSFSSSLQSEAPTYEMNYENGRYSVTLTDTRNVLKNFYVSSNGGVSTAINGNTLTLSSSAPITNAASIKLNRIIPYTVDTTGFLIWSVPGKEGQNQDMVSGVPANNDPVPAYLRVEAPAGSARIVKTSEDGEVEGITFTMTGNGINKTVTTGAGGTVQIDNLRPGVYTVTEQGYDKYEPQETRSVTVVSGQTATVAFNNRLKRGGLTVTKTAEDGLSKGMKFHLSGTSLSGFPVDEYAVVGSDGKARFQGVLIGSGYTLEEVDTPDRYIVPADQIADIEWNKVTNKSFDNDLKRGDLTVTKTAEDGLSKGMKFHLSGTSLSGIAVDEYATVGSDGKAYFHDILIGSGYTLEEVDTPDRYVVPEKQTADIEWNKVMNKSFDNVLKKWNLTVTKRDSETGTAQGDASLAGAVYGIYKGERLIDRYTTDANGQFTTQYYLCGDDWSLREITPSEGYQLDEAIHHIGAEARNYTVEYNALSDTVKERNTKGRIAIIKHCDDGGTQIETPEVGAEFEVYLKSSGSYTNAKESERDYLICDENGFAETKLLPYGVYTVRQTKGWDGRELMKPFDVYISKNGQTYRYLINNATFESLVEIVKKDIETGKVIPASGIGFKVRNTDTGEYVVQHINYPTPIDIDTYYTDSTGKLMLPEPLGFGNYEIIEQNTCCGYVLDSTPVPFKVDGSQTVVTVEKHNTPQKGMIKISKTGEVFSSVMESGGLYQPVYSAQGLAGAVFEVTAAEDIVTLDGTLRYAKGTVVAEITTGADGTAATKPLYLGKYKIVEKTAPFGMILNPDPVFVELTYAGQEVEITETAASFHNERQKVKVSLSKMLEQNELFGIGMNGELANITFGLYAAEDIQAADGSRIPANGIIEIISFDKGGHAVCRTDLPLGKYYLQEHSTDSHYTLSNTKFPFEFAYAGQGIPKIDIAVNNGEAIINHLKYGSVSGFKVDEDGKSIAGAKFGLFRTDETEYAAENALMTAVSDADGIFRFDNIPIGTWIVRELVPAEGFVLNTQAYQVTVTEHEQVIEITVENRYVRGDILGHKVDEDGKVIAGALFGLFPEGTEEFTEGTAFMTAESDETGIFRFEQIRYGNWYVKELRPAEGFVPNEKLYKATVAEEGAVIEFTVENKYIRGNIQGLKVDEDGQAIAGAVFGLFEDGAEEFTEEAAVITAISDADGTFLFENVRYGKWVVRELKPADGFVLNETLYPAIVAEDGDIIEIKAENRHVYGSVMTIKVDADYPDHLLTGAVFEIYRDVNGNGTFDAGIDVLIGEMEETEKGLYLMEKLRYGGYFLHEKKAPDAFVLDDGYYFFSITTDGETVVVENNAGIGFINQAQKGSLKIVKTASDGKKEGFAFRITGPDGYDQTFTTNASGEILIEDLRVGEYVVAELHNDISAGYQVAGPVTVELVADEVLTVNVHNEKITVDVPKTGDNSNLWAWISLMALSLTGMIVTRNVPRRKKRANRI